jgi:hypothetical protein
VLQQAVHAQLLKQAHQHQALSHHVAQQATEILANCFVGSGSTATATAFATNYMVNSQEEKKRQEERKRQGEAFS